MTFTTAEVGGIYQINTVLTQWDEAIVIFKDKGDMNKFTVNILSSNSVIIEVGIRSIRWDTVIGQEATIDYLGCIKNNPEYLL